MDSPVELASCCSRGGHVAGPATRTDEMLFTEKKILRDYSFNFEHFDILWASNGHSYHKLYPFEVKNFFP